MKVGVIIAAGGIGSRMGLGSSKQLMLLAGEPVLARSAAIFEVAAVEEIVIVIDSADVERCRNVVDKFGFRKVSGVFAGGENRSQSVWNGMQKLGPNTDTVLIHDGARPLFPPELLAAGLREFGMSDCDGVVFGLPVTDTIKEVGINNRLVAGTPDRSRLWAVQTPQIFRRAVLEKAYRVSPVALAAASDDASLVERAGGLVKMIMGSPENIKITTPADLVIAEEILRRRGNNK